MWCEGKGTTTDMAGMLSKMMEGCGPAMMIDMMPQCIGMMLQHIPKEKRTDFVLKTVTTLMEEVSAEMSEDEKKDFRTKVVEKVKA